jgi:23S rRNA (uracil1939-C5)-methyltransferase
MTMRGKTIESDITALGSQGDGVANMEGAVLHVPYTVPGDRVRLTLGKGDAVTGVEILSDGDARIAPACPHFGACGGCALQHVRDDVYGVWKRDRVIEALGKRGLRVPVDDLIRIPPGVRRRVRLGARATQKGVVLGFKQRRSHQLVNISECPVTAPDIVAILPGLRDLLTECLGASAAAEISVTVSNSGLDVAVDTKSPIELAQLESLAHWAEEVDLARLSWGGDPIVQRRAVQVAVGGVPVNLPDDAFLQPSRDGAAALGEMVVSALRDASMVADLYAGWGAFGLALAAIGKTVQAYESDPAQIAALTAAARRAGLDQKIAGLERDLRYRPLAADELNGLDGLALDPPRAGAAEQVNELAASAIPIVAYVSCNPASFARDARILVDGGYGLDRVTPIDQFLWSPHVELAAIFRR